MSDEINVVAFLRVKPGQEDAFIEAATPCIEASRKEEGNLHYVLNRDPGDATRFVYIERYASRQALKDHTQTAHFKTFSKAIEGRLEAAPEILVLDPLAL